MPAANDRRPIDSEKLEEAVQAEIERLERRVTGKESWRDWLGDEPAPTELFTRDEIATRANASLNAGHYKPVKPGDLRLWEQLGILPRGVRQWHNGAARNTYPDWQAHLARHVRQLQREGLSLEEIRPRIRAYARMVLGYGRTEIDEEIGRPVETPEQLALWPDLVTELERLGRWWSHLQDVDVDRIEVHVIGTNGRATRYPLPIAQRD